MKLLKIAEPGQQDETPNADACRVYAAGIDLGTTHSLIALATEGKPRTLVDKRGQDIIPSVVYYGGQAKDAVVVGEAAMAKGRADARNSIASVKRLMGRSCADIKTDRFASIYEIVPGESDLPLIITAQGKKNAVEVSAAILNYLRQLAEQEISDKLTGVVITVPAYFDDAQRQAVKDAAQLAELNTYRLLNEPTAAALAYGLDKGAEGTIAVYDLGGGTFDISILRLEKGLFRVLATGGDSMLGGDDFDRALALWCLNSLNASGAADTNATDKTVGGIASRGSSSLNNLNKKGKEAGDTNDAAKRLDALAARNLNKEGAGETNDAAERLDALAARNLNKEGAGETNDAAERLDTLTARNLNKEGAGDTNDAARRLDALVPSAKRALLQQARQIKEELSAKQSLTTNLQLGEETSQIHITRADLERIIHPLINRTINLCQNALKDAGLGTADIASVVPVGGSTRIPLVRQVVGDFFGKAPLTGIDPDRVVAYGAALQADLLAGNQKDNLLLLDVIPLSLGLETMGGLNERLIPRNASIPTSQHHDFTTYKDGQTAMSFHIVQGEQELVKDCRSLAHFVLRGIPPQPAGLAKVRVTFQVDADGLLSVSAQELSAGIRTGVEVKPTYGLSAQEIKNMLGRAAASAQSDLAQRQLKEAQLEGRKIIDIITKAMGEDKAPLSDQEKRDIQTCTDNLVRSLQGQSAEAIRSQIDKLSQAAEEFMQRRMSLTLKEVVKGPGR